jgi:hydroxymethylbilane synthase
VATRASRLSLKQVALVVKALRRRHPSLEVEPVLVKTTGDLNPDRPPSQLGVKGVFEREVDRALLQGEADIAVHSLKDVPTTLPEELVLAAVLARETPLEALVSRRGLKLEELPPGAVVGTSSVRRRAAVRWVRPDLKVEDLRGNVDTRLRRLDEGRFDAILLAAAGLRRLGLGDRIVQLFPPEVITPAPCQGAVGVYARREDSELLKLLAAIDDAATRLEVMVERAVVERLKAGCFTPLGVVADASDSRVKVTAALYAPDGGARTLVRTEGGRAEALALAERAARHLLEGGIPVVKGSGRRP